MSQMEVPTDAQVILASPEIFRADYEVSIKVDRLFFLLIGSVVYAMLLLVMNLQAWPFPSAWLLVAFCYPLIPWLAWFRPGLKLSRQRQLILTEAGLVILDKRKYHAWKWSEISRFAISNHGVLDVYAEPHWLALLLIFSTEDSPTLRVPYHPALRELYINLAEGKIQLPDKTRFTYFDHPRLLPGPAKDHD